jgi:hypothetical protein
MIAHINETAAVAEIRNLAAHIGLGRPELEAQIVHHAEAH